MSSNERICDLCATYVPEREGLHHLAFRLFVHHEKCSDRIRAMEKDYSLSKRGRFRIRSEALALLNLAFAPGPLTPAPCDPA